MSKLTDFLHKLVDHVGASSLHGAIDELDKETTPASEKDSEEVTDAAE